MRSTKTKLQQMREDQNLSKAELARRTGMQGGVIAWVESGRFLPYDSQLTKLANALKWEGDPNDLLKEVERW